jgi:hypothetical protein
VAFSFLYNHILSTRISLYKPMSCIFTVQIPISPVPHSIMSIYRSPYTKRTMRKQIQRKIPDYSRFTTLPDELKLHIFSFLPIFCKDKDGFVIGTDLSQAYSLRLVCKEWNAFIIEAIRPEIMDVLSYIPVLPMIIMTQFMSRLEARQLVAELMSYKTNDINIEFFKSAVVERVLHMFEKTERFSTCDNPKTKQWLVSFLSDSKAVEALISNPFPRLSKHRKEIESLELCIVHSQEIYQRRRMEVPYLIGKLGDTIKKQIYYIYVKQSEYRRNVLISMTVRKPETGNHL